MRRLALLGLIWLFFLGSIAGCGSDNTGEPPKETKKRTRFVPDPQKE
jgi:hypothetical protein